MISNRIASMLVSQDYEFLQLWSFKTGYSVKTWEVVEEFLSLFSLRSFSEIRSDILLYWVHYCRSFSNFEYKVDIIRSVVTVYNLKLVYTFNLDFSYIFNVSQLIDYQDYLSLISHQGERLASLLTEFIWLTGAKIDFLPLLSWSDFSLLSDQQGYRVTIPFSTNCIIFAEFRDRLQQLGGERLVFVDQSGSFLSDFELEKKIDTLAQSSLRFVNSGSQLHKIGTINSVVIRESRNFYLAKNLLG